MAPLPPRSSAKTKILDAALVVIRAKGHAATTEELLCAASNVMNHLRRYIEDLFNPANQKGRRS